MGICLGTVHHRIPTVNITQRMPFLQLGYSQFPKLIWNNVNLTTTIPGPWITNKFPCKNLCWLIKDFQAWYLIGWQHSQQPIRSHVRNSLLTWILQRNPGPSPSTKMETLPCATYLPTTTANYHTHTGVNTGCQREGCDMMKEELRQ